jgi:hypothetical protein
LQHNLTQLRIKIVVRSNHECTPLCNGNVFPVNDRLILLPNTAPSRPCKSPLVVSVISSCESASDGHQCCPRRYCVLYIGRDRTLLGSNPILLSYRAAKGPHGTACAVLSGAVRYAVSYKCYWPTGRYSLAHAPQPKVIAPGYPPNIRTRLVMLCWL